MIHNIMAVFIMVIGLYIAMASSNLIKKLIGLNMFQVSALLLYISVAHIKAGRAPLVSHDSSVEVIYHNPLPHVLMLTAIVVGISTIVVGLAIVCRIHGLTGTVDQDGLASFGRINDGAD